MIGAARSSASSESRSSSARPGEHPRPWSAWSGSYRRARMPPLRRAAFGAPGPGRGPDRAPPRMAVVALASRHADLALVVRDPGGSPCCSSRHGGNISKADSFAPSARPLATSAPFRMPPATTRSTLSASPTSSSARRASGSSQEPPRTGRATPPPAEALVVHEVSLRASGASPTVCGPVRATTGLTWCDRGADEKWCRQ